LSTKNIIKCVIVESSVYIQLQLLNICIASGYDVVGKVESGKQAFNVVASTYPDVVFIDANLTDYAPSAVIRGLLAINRRLKIILLAPLTLHEEIHRLLSIGATDYLPKPIVESQARFILQKIKITREVHAYSKLQAISKLHSLYYNEIVKYSTREDTKIVKNALSTPLKRLKKNYSDRYDIDLNSLSIIVKDSEIQEENKNEYSLIKRQLDNLYRSLVKNLIKPFDERYVKSLLQVAYQDLVLLAEDIIEKTEYTFPTFNGYVPTHRQTEFFKVKKLSRSYLPLSDFTWAYNALDISHAASLRTYSIAFNADPRNIKKFPRAKKLDTKNFQIYGILSVFDEIYGPKSAIITPKPSAIENEQIKEIPKLLDMAGVREYEPFMHASEIFGSVNIIFSIKREDLRGGSSYLMLSVVITPLEVQALVRVSQLRGIFNAVVGQIAYSLENMTSSDYNNLGKFKSEPTEIINDLLTEIKDFFK
jgi:DNA-binding NarL/FixJ family response regulator